MRNILLGSAAAAALIFGMTGAMAQYNSPSGGAAPAQKEQGQSRSGAEAPKAQAPMEHRSVSGSEKSTGAAGQNEKMPGASTTDRSAPKGEMKKSGEAAAPNKATHAQTDQGKARSGAATTEPKTGRSVSSPAKDQGRMEGAKDEGRMEGTKDQGRMEGAKSTNARAANAPAANIDAQKQERIRSVVSASNTENITNATFNVRVGTTVPERYQFRPLPTEIVDIVPQYRGYDYMVVNNDIVIVDPRTRRIVYTMAEGRSVGLRHRPVDCR